ncbi:MAG: hypothetical protein M1838_001946 [Thelocarpon superellum]|nr:MAG: hypothetical protein M1838_001946 [Thelocarpon superellum]
MAAAIDYNALKAQTLGSGNDEEAVTVNTRALIDKVLARYSGEWTTLRELLQNAADASADKVTIRFETTPSLSVAAPTATDESSSLKHTVLHHTLHRLVVANNGQPFGASDWSRLKRIAEGNPDETKIGAFGVGFYSVFADCEEPFVSSGQEAMAFYWKGNALFTRRSRLADAQSDTTFVLDYRSKTSPVPPLLPLCQFLATSLTFVGLKEIELWLDGWKLLALSKKTAPSSPVALPRDVERTTHERLMKVHQVDTEMVQMEARWLEIVRWRPPPSWSRMLDSGATDHGASSTSAPSLRGFFSRLTGANNSTTQLRDDRPPAPEVADNLLAASTATIFLRVTTGHIRVSVDTSFAREIERATKKKPAQGMKVAILSGALPLLTGVEIFSTVLPQKSGKVFIGFPTQQTTGVTGVHVSAPSVIPTVEREAIDLNARYVRTWNVEVLRAAGIVCRVAWANELMEIKGKLSRAVAASGKGKMRKEDVATVLPDAIHVFKQFTFLDATPSAKVGQLIEEAFWTSTTQASIDVVSTQGVLPSHQVRLASEDLSGFVEGIPVLPDALIQGAPELVGKLKDYGLVTAITTADVKKELEAKALDGSQLTEFLKWLARQAFALDVPRPTTRSLLDVAVATVDGQVLVLANITSFVNASKIPVDVPVPGTTIPFEYTKHLTKAELEALGWEELQIVPWLRDLIERAGAREADEDITRSPTFAAQVLAVLSKQWDALSQSSRGTVVSLLEDRTVIPTKMGMKRPGEAYFPTVKLFQDLPIASGLHGVKDKILLALGVRKTVELSVVFGRLMSDADAPGAASTTPEGRWSHVDLIRYLAAVRDDIPAADIKRLQQTAICPAEENQNPARPSRQRYRVVELYEPKDSLRSLGLPILQWPGLYRPGTAEGKFLAFLGLRAIPTVPELVEIMATAPARGDLALRDRAMTYFIANHQINGYARFPTLSSMPQAYLPLQGDEKATLLPPSQCFTNERAAVLGFPILRRDLHPHAHKFGVQSDPPMAECVRYLLKQPPLNRAEAVLVFAYLASRLHEISGQHAEKLGQAMIVPITARPSAPPSSVARPASGGVRHAAPRMVFLGDSPDLKDVFDFVDFGSEANAFLLKCGSKHEPTKIQLATMLVQEPARLLSVFQSPERYLGVLRSLADHVATLRKDKALFKEMRRVPFLLAYREIPATTASTSAKETKSTEDPWEDADEDEAAGIKEWSLASASQIVLVDDFLSYNLFRERLKVAPQEEKIEEFYYSLGSSLLSSLVEEEPRVGAVVPDQRPAAKLQKLVYERARLFLHDNAAEAIKHDARWLEKNLTVQAVRSISLRRMLRGHQLSHTETRTAAVTYVARKGWTLWISAASYDLFQVSQALVGLLLSRPKPQSAIMLEMLLGTDLLKLRTRGYNVDRILRAKAAEARISEDQRQQALEEEQRKIREQEQAWTATHPTPAAAPPTPKALPAMPGAFEDSPEPAAPGAGTGAREPASKKRNNFFSSISKHLGLDDGGPSAQQLHSLMGHVPRPDVAPNHQPAPPPPYATKDPQTTRPAEHQPDSVTAPFRLRQNLVSAINASRAHDSAHLYSRADASNVKETSSYCDERPGHDISFAADSTVGIKIFLSNALADKSSFLATHSSSLNLFARLLVDCGEIFALPRGTLHIYYDDAGSTIAFNRQGSLFCNFRFFEQLHLAGVQAQNAELKGEALIYWWVVLCHELAHNLVEVHSAEHSYWTENFVAQYFGKAVTKLVTYNTPTGGSAGASTTQMPASSLLD